MSQGGRIGFLAVGHGVTALVEGQLFLKAQNGVTVFKVTADVGRSLFSGPGNDFHFALGGVVLIFHTGGPHHGIFVDLRGDGFIDNQFPHHVPQLLRRNAARPQKPGHRAGQINNGGFHAHVAGAAVHNGVNAALHIVAHMLRRGSAGLTGPVGRRGSNGYTGQPDNLPCNGCARAADRHRVQSRCGTSGHRRAAGQHHGQGTRPEPFRQTPGGFGNGVANLPDILRLGHMENQWVILGTALGLKDFQDGITVQTIGSQPVNRLCGQSHQAAVFENLCGFLCRLEVLGR